VQRHETGAGATQSPIDPGPQHLAHNDSGREEGKVNAPLYARWNYAYRCSGRRERGQAGDSRQSGEPGLWELQGVWGLKDWATFITVRELRAVRLLLEGGLGVGNARAG
jgi:hypothetical protein